MANTQKPLYTLYLNVRPRIQEASKAYDTLQDIVARYPDVQTELTGVAHDSHRATFCFGFTVPVSDKDAAAINTLHCINAIFSSMYDYLPCYCAEPTDNEKNAAQAYLDHRLRTFIDDTTKPQTDSTIPLETAKALVPMGVAGENDHHDDSLQLTFEGSNRSAETGWEQ